MSRLFVTVMTASAAAWTPPQPTAAQAASTAASGAVDRPARAAVETAQPAFPAWLAGCWVARSGTVRVDEVWMAPEGGLMVGMSRTVGEGRPPAWELLALTPHEGALAYSAHPSGQALTRFPAVRVAPDTLRFEKPDHDFPRAIEYRRTASDSLLALVFGEVDADEPAFGLRYAREPCPGG